MKYENLINKYIDKINKISSNSKQWKAFLDTSASVTSYSFINRVLIHCYFPSAKAVASEDLWKALNRDLISKPKKIFLLNDTDKSVTKAYDISQTEGKDVDLWKFDSSDMSPALIQELNKEFDIEENGIYNVIVQMTNKIESIIPSVNYLNEHEQNFIIESVSYIVNKRLYQLDMPYKFKELDEVYSNITVMGGCIAVISNKIINTAKNIARTYKENQSQGNYKFEYKIGSEVYLDSRKYIVADINADRVVVSNADFPLEQKSYSSVELEEKLKETPLNQRLIVLKEKTEPSIESYDNTNILPKSKKSSSLEEKTYKAVQELFPDILSMKYSYLRYESDIYEPLSIEYNGLLYIEQNYIQNGDLMKDPLFIFSVDDSNKQMILKYKEQDGVPNGYEEYDESNDEHRQSAQRYFLETWLPAIKEQNILNHLTKGEKILDDGSYKYVVFENGIEYEKGKEPSLQDILENDTDDSTNQSNETISVKDIDEIDNDKIINLAELNANNYILSEKDFVSTTFSVNISNNLKAIKLLKQIESEKKTATTDEQEILAKYVGWGGLSDVFNPKSIYYNDELRTILTDKEYFSARSSTLSAFYTGQEIISSVYSALEQFGFKSGNILDPSSGTGRFIGMCPESIKNNSKFYAVELDSISARITKLLYPGAEVYDMGLEDTDFKDNQFDIAISNIPFGNYKVFDKKYDKENFLIHDYFFAKNIDLIRPKGIIAFITSSGTLDKKSEKFRRYISERADFIGAIRLPGNAFEDAGTNVVSDIIFLQKKETPSNELNDNILPTVKFTESFHMKEIEINNYFAENPDMIAGKLSSKSTAFGYDTDVIIPYGTDNLANRLKRIVPKLECKYESDNTIKPIDRAQEDNNFIPADPNINEYSYGISNGKIYYREINTMSLAKFSKSEYKKISELIELAKVVRTIINLQRDEIESGYLDNSKFDKLKNELNKKYDDFINEYGYINENLKGFIMDNSSPLLSSIEIYNSESKSYEKSQFFYKRTIRPDKQVTNCETSLDALYISLDQKCNVNLEFMSELTGFSKDKLIKDLAFTQIYPNHKNTKEWIYKEDYLSGNIRKKLSEAKQQLLLEPDNDLIKSDIKALEEILPEWLTISDISVKLGSPWIPTSYIDSFIDSIGLMSEGVKCIYYESDNSFYIDNKNQTKYSTNSINVYGTEYAPALFILEKALNQQRPKVYDRIYDDNGKAKSVVNQEKTDAAMEKQEVLAEAFAEFCENNAEELEKIYNERFNCKVAPAYDGSYLTFPEMSTEIELLPHQKNAVARCLRGNTLLAHCVGAGKTFEMIAAGMKMKQLGLCNKPIYVVPNHLVQSFAGEFMRLYPTADIIAVDKSDLKKENRKRFTSRIATGTYDGIIIAASSFEFLQLSDARKTKYYYDQIDELRFQIDYSDNDYSVKQAERMITSYQNKLDKLMDKTKSDNFIDFEDLGIDQMFIDEAHSYKNLYCPTKLGSVSGVNNSSSVKSENMLLKTEYLAEIRGVGKGTVFATGTPVSNYLTEMYVMNRYLAPEKLKEIGCYNIDAWIGTFGSITNSVEVNPSGNGFRVKERLNRFNNIPELLVDYYSFADVKTKDNIKLPLPKVNKVTVTLEPTDLQKDYITDLGLRAENIKSGTVDPSEDNFLKITTDGIKCALDYRLIDPTAPDVPNSKINAVVDKVYKEYLDHNDMKGTQIIFLDRSTPKSNGEFNLYDDIKNKLIALGINESEIVFIHQAKNDYEKQKIFDKVNSGEYRIILGSTEKLGTGTNIQKLCCALHHVDLGWRPSDKEQRLGRMERQGNTMPYCTEYCYVVKDTFDAYIAQTLESKASFIAQINRGDLTSRSIEVAEDIALEYTEIKALSCGDERIKTKIELEIEIKKLNQSKRRFNKNQKDLRYEYSGTLPIEIERLKNSLITIEKCLEVKESNPPFESDDFEIYLYDSLGEKKICIDKKIAGLYLLNTKQSIADMDRHKVAYYRGFDLTVYYSALKKHYRMALTYEEKDCYSFDFSDSEIGMIARINNAIDKGLSASKQQIEETIAKKEERRESIKSLCNGVFEDEDKLKNKLEELKRLNKELNITDNNVSAINTSNNISARKTSYRR